MFARRFSAVHVASPCCAALRFFHRPRMLTEPGVLPTTAWGLKASVGRFDAKVPRRAIASVATAVSRARRKSERQPPSPGEPPTNKGRQPCNRTQEKLDELLERNYGTRLYSVYFFKGTQTNGHARLLKKRYNIDSKDFCDRCIDCGLKISEHRASTSSVGPALKKNERNPRAPRVLGIHAGTGSGKTHALLDAAQHLEATTAIYITYNMGQGLKLDHSDPSIASLLRILLRHPSNENLSNWSCDKAFGHCKAELSQLDEVWLLDFVVSYIVKQEKSHNARAAHVVIAVDEIRKLMATSNVPVLQTTSTLGLLASKLEGTGVKCTVIVSALTESSFVTMSDRRIVKVLLPQPSDEARDFIVKQLLGKRKPTEPQMAMLVAACGTHFRSIVAGCQALFRNIHLNVWTLLDRIGERIEQNMDEFERGAIRDYTRRCVSVGRRDALQQTPVVAPFLGSFGSLAPPIVCTAFKEDAEMPEFCHPAEKLLEVTTFISAPKQLEHCGYHYDRFRALYGLPVVPYGVKVRNGGSLGAKWFKQLTFPDEIAYKENVDTSSLFAVKRKIVIRTKHKLKFEKYSFPNDVNHPYIDRACLAVQPRGNRRCLVLYQDKINANGMLAAVKGLNAAATALHEEMKIPVLCVAQVIGAPLHTTSQNDFKHPYILIRDDEVSQFYTPTFAAALRFVRRRHFLRNPLF